MFKYEITDRQTTKRPERQIGQRPETIKTSQTPGIDIDIYFQMSRMNPLRVYGDNILDNFWTL